MNMYIIGGLIVAAMILIWAIASERAYKLGYEHALEDMKIVNDYIKKMVQNEDQKVKDET